MAAPAVAKPKFTETFIDNKRKDDIRMANIAAAQSVADAVRTSLGPKGMDKMISTSSGEVIITNDGATILNKMEVLQPAAKFLVELSKSQDVVAGDGTTTVVVIAGALLKASLTLLSAGIHPTVVSDALNKASIKAVDVLSAMAIPVELSDRDSLVKSASTSLNSKVPVGRATLCHIMNVIGEPIDEKGDIKTDHYLPIHREAPAFVEQATEQQILVTGIKA